MHSLRIAPESGRPLRFLTLGAHSDDIEIGCGGALLALLERHPGSEVTWVVLSGGPERAAEAVASATDFLAGAGDREIRTLAFEESYFPAQHRELKLAIEDLKSVEPDVIFTHRGDDLHQDHRLVSELVWNSFRDHLVLEYEIPKYDADLSATNIFVSLSRELCERKCGLLRRHFASQRHRHWFDEEIFMGLMRLRGMEGRSPSGYAEAFRVRKVQLV